MQGSQRIHITPSTVECPHIPGEFWNKICDFIGKFEETGDNKTLYCLFGRVADKKCAKGDATGILQLAWRCLYAETVAVCGYWFCMILPCGFKFYYYFLL